MQRGLFIHTAPGIPDEYTSSGLWGWGEEQSTITNEHRREFIRWRAWIDPDTPVPTPYNKKYLDKVGLFEGGQSRLAHIYRPTARGCIMGAGSFAGNPKGLCVVCRQQAVMRFYKWVDAIDERIPAVDQITIPNACRIKFSVKRVHPVPDTQKTQWSLNGKVIATNTDSIEVDFDIFEQYELEFSLVDESKYIRPDPPFADYPRASTRWTIRHQNTTTASKPIPVDSNDDITLLQNDEVSEPRIEQKQVDKKLQIITSKVYASSGGENNGYVEIKVAGGQSPYRFFWSDGVETSEPERHYLHPGEHSVTVQDKSGTRQSYRFTIESEPAFYLLDLKMERVGKSEIRIANADKDMEYLWFKKDHPAWLPRYPLGIYSGTYTTKNGSIYEADAYVIQNQGGFYAKLTDGKPNDKTNWAHVMLFENGRKKDPRNLSLELSMHKRNGSFLLSAETEDSEGKLNGTLKDGLMIGSDEAAKQGTFKLRYTSRPNQVDIPVAIGDSFRVSRPGHFYIAARKKSNGAISMNRLGIAVDKKPDIISKPIHPKMVKSSKMIMWLDANDINGDGIIDEPYKIPHRRGAIINWQGKANNVNFKGFIFYEPNSLNGKAVASWKTIWVQPLNKSPKNFKTIIMVRREHSLSSKNTAPWFGLSPLIGVGDYGKNLFSNEAAKALKNSKVYLNGKKINPKTVSMPQDFYIVTYEFGSNINEPLGPTDGHWEGDIAECLVFEKKLSKADRRGIEEYLRQKWLSAVDL